MDRYRYNKINAVLDMIKAVWLNHPELRLGQLLLNATAMEPEAPNFKAGDPDLFYVSDDTLINAVKQYSRRTKEE